MTKANDWKTPLGYYERAIVELTRTREEVQSDLQSFQQTIKDLQSSQVNLQLELESTKTELQATQVELQATQTKLQAVKREYQNTQAELQDIKLELKITNQRLESSINQVQTKSDSAYLEAKAAQDIASKAIVEVEVVEKKLKHGNIIVQKALMLQGEDDKHWMKFQYLKKGGYHTFSIWNSEKKTWHKVVRVNVADKIVD